MNCKVYRRRVIGLPPGWNSFKNYLDESELFPYKNNKNKTDQEERELLNKLQSFFEWHPRKNHMYYFAHKHRLTFYHDNNNKKVECSACHKAIEYAMYGCPKCPTIWFHKSCAELPRKIQEHPLHTLHPLVLLDRPIPSDPKKGCSGCELPLGDSGFYGCTECEIFIHKFCLELPREINHISHPYHPLSLEQELPNCFHCDACSAYHWGLNYSCKRRDYNLGIRCIGKEATKRDGNPKGHILTLLGKQPSRHRDDFCLRCGEGFHLAEKSNKRFHWRPPVFRCKKCKFSLHRDCVLPFVLPLLPDTFASKKHSHPLSLTSYFDPDFNSIGQMCDVCKQLIPPDSLFYYCKDCIFAEDWTCVLSEKRWSLAHNKVDHVELDIIPVVIDNPPSTVAEIIDSFTPEDMAELNELVKAAIGNKLDQQDDGNLLGHQDDHQQDEHQQDDRNELDQQDDRNKLYQPFHQILQSFKSKFADKRFGMSYCQTRFQVTEVPGLDFTMPKNLVPICKVLVDSNNNYLNRNDTIKSRKGKTFIFTILCAAMYSLWTVEEVTADQLFTYWDCFQIAKTAGFEIEVAFDRLSKVMHAFLAPADHKNRSVTNQDDFDKEVRNIRSEMEKLLHIARTERKASMLVAKKDHGSKDSIEIERVGENSWNESEEVTSNIFDSVEIEIAGENSWNELKDEGVPWLDEGVPWCDEEVPWWDPESDEEEEEDVGENLPDESSEVGSEEEEDLSSNMIEDTPGEISEQEEDVIAKARDDQESPSDILKPDTKVGEEKSIQMLEPREQKKQQQQAISKPSEILKPDTKVGEEKLSEMPEPREQKKAISELPNPWDCNKKAIPKDPAERIRDFNEGHRSKSLSLCSHRLSRSGRRKSSTLTGEIGNKDGVVKDEKNLCIACELPILEGKNETFKYCSTCNIFLHQFCVKYPPEIQHPLHLLHPLKLKVDREKKEIKCNVCEEKCRGCAYYWCDECNFYLEAQFLFQEPVQSSRCHGKVFRLPLKQHINQNPIGCFACGKKIVPGFSTDFLRCAPCNVNLHVKCSIPSRIIRSFHRHSLDFISNYDCGSQCDFCGKEMEGILRPSYICRLCDKYFHIECATSNIM